MNIIKSSSGWLVYAFATTVSWGIWGALIESPEKNGFPATMGYIAWALTMIPCAIVGLKITNWKLETSPKAIVLGMAAGLTGAGGQIILFQALREGPAYIIFPIISLYPIVTIALSTTLLKESATRRQAFGICLALIAIYLLSYSNGEKKLTEGHTWLILSALVFLAWGLQAYVMKFANQSMKAESIFFYMTISGLTLIPIAYYMTDTSQEINYGWDGAYAAFFIHLLNSFGALALVYALRHGKAIIVVPLTGLSPLITITLSLILYNVWPSPTLLAGMLVALVAMYLFSK
ncbi:EamA-like transporter family protein [Reichenbachiella sp. 5M10]|uniref:DMT family transporter n=1 Tax=Reichenbachiella sp. 5M10 TaxID=1889772 RepID=UPI000C14EE96|nr:DMT family transporter [Reichenbachiella sp. 5M10]PIB34231.1 EamA-like transporter family protein [Reichenbachiella sp. 5M10]